MTHRDLNDGQLVILRDCYADSSLALDNLPYTRQFEATTRQRAKKQMSLEVASEACMQAFGASTSRKGLENQPLEVHRFSAAF